MVDGGWSKLNTDMVIEQINVVLRLISSLNDKYSDGELWMSTSCSCRCSFLCPFSLVSLNLAVCVHQVKVQGSTGILLVIYLSSSFHPLLCWCDLYFSLYVSRYHRNHWMLRILVCSVECLAKNWYRASLVHFMHSYDPNTSRVLFRSCSGYDMRINSLQ